ncbi:hypothetical protein [Undibacterium sp. RuTC16W]|uniref:hypothetical protein n=1 Tax=Undibacterium sp. RuTC16W TaxID=3413048 RepID=UPI003BEF685D
MKKILSFCVLLFSLNTCFAEDYLDVVTSKSCACIDKIPSNADKRNLKMQMGFCMLEAFSKDDKDKFKKEFNLDFYQLDKNGEKIGTIVGMRMATQCPKTVMAMANADKQADSDMLNGTITKIEKDNFATFFLKDNEGKTTKLYWLGPVQTTMDLPTIYQTLVGKTVEVQYENKDIFDPKIGEYRQFKVITKLK